MIASRALPYRYMGHAIDVLLGRHDTPDAPGEISHRQALAAALSNTMGLGNIAGVALAIVAGGPGAVFWMWVSAIVGVATKFFTCSLGVMYRGEDSLGNLQGGPMYVIREALPKRFYPLAVMFALAGLIGTLPLFQANQLTVLIQATIFAGNAPAGSAAIIGLALAALVGSVIFGGLPRVANVAVALLPSMMVVYLSMTLWVMAHHAAAIPGIFASIFAQAVSPTAVGGGALGVMLIGISRGAFSNEAGVGTEVMAHGAAKTREPIREGILATLAPYSIRWWYAVAPPSSSCWPENGNHQATSLALHSAPTRSEPKWVTSDSYCWALWPLCSALPPCLRAGITVQNVLAF